MLNKFAAKCRECGKKVYPGNGKLFKEEGKWLVLGSCCDPEAIAEREAVAKAAAEKAAVLAAKKAALDALIAKCGFGERKEVSYSQSSYSDEYEYEMPFSGEVSEDELRNACHKPSQSSWGALRWSRGEDLVKIDWDKKVVVVAGAVGICD